MRTEQEIVAAIEELRKLGAGACLNGHRPDAQVLLDEWLELPMDDAIEPEDLPPMPEAVEWLWDQLEPLEGPKTYDDGIDHGAIVLERNRLKVSTWMAEVEALLLEHWGDIKAFTGESVDVSTDSGIQSETFTPGAATDKANDLWMQWEHLDRSQSEVEGEVDMLLLHKLFHALEDHLDPERIITNHRREYFRPRAEPLPPVTEMEPVEDFKATWSTAARSGALSTRSA